MHYQNMNENHEKHSKMEAVAKRERSEGLLVLQKQSDFGTPTSGSMK